MITINPFRALRPKETLAKEVTCPAYDALDVSILQNYVLNPLPGIQDPRADKRIAFYGGDNMLNDIREWLHTDIEVAFLLYPTQIQEIIEVSYNKAIMPPKSTWFEPKLISELFHHKM